MSAILFQIQSTLIVLLMIVGLYYRRQRSRHVKIMSAVIIWDVLLILQIELTRSAIIKASKAMANPMILNIHVSFAVTTVLCYVILVLSGRKLLKGQAQVRTLHKRFGWLAFTLRVLTYATSFFAVTQIAG